jgi:hypothetical protein
VVDYIIRGMKMGEYIILVAVLLILLVGCGTALAGKGYADLDSVQKQHYWSCIKEDCTDFLKNKQYGEWRSCVYDCIKQAEEVEPIPEDELFCEDTDSGIDYKNFGTVTDNKNPDGKDDYCYTFPNGKVYLFEGKCANNKYSRAQKNCKEFGETYSCQEGACVNSICDDIENAVVGEYPNCEISCNEGYVLENNVCVKINVAPVLEPIGNKKIAVAGEFSIEIIATDDEELEYSAIGLPEGAELNDNIFTWTAEENQVGEYEITFIVTDGEFTVEKNVEVEVFANLGCYGVTEKKDYFGLDGTLFQYKGSDKNTDTSPNIKFKTYLNGDSWETLEYAFGIDGTVVIKYNGNKYKFINASSTDVDDCDMMYKCNHAPVLDFIGNKKIKIDQELVIELSATDEDGDALQYYIATMPTGAELNGNIFTWTLTEDQIGEYYVMFIVSDGELEDSEVVKISEDLECDDIVKDNEYFILDNILLQYKGADKNSVSSPKVKIKIVNTGEILERSVSFSQGQGSFDLKIDGNEYEFISASDTNQKDWDLMYKCG